MTSKKNILLVLLVLTVLVFSSFFLLTPRKIPVTSDYQNMIGIWQTTTGEKVIIRPDGSAEYRGANLTIGGGATGIFSKDNFSIQLGFFKKQLKIVKTAEDEITLVSEDLVFHLPIRPLQAEVPPPDLTPPPNPTTPMLQEIADQNLHLTDPKLKKTYETQSQQTEKINALAKWFEKELQKIIEAGGSEDVIAEKSQALNAEFKAKLAEITSR